MHIFMLFIILFIFSFSSMLCVVFKDPFHFFCLPRNFSAYLNKTAELLNTFLFDFEFFNNQCDILQVSHLNFFIFQKMKYIKNNLNEYNFEASFENENVI